MSFLDFANSIRLALQALNDTRERESIIIGQELTALIRRRVQNEKVNSEGDIFGFYSPAWAKVREDNNLPTEAKDFTFTGEMWRDTGVLAADNTNASTTVVIGGQTQRAIELLAFNSERDGNLLAPSDEEIQFVTDAHEERVFTILNKYLS